MKEKILSPTYPESVEEGVIANWKKLEGEMIIQDEVLAEIETDKVVIEVVAANEDLETGPGRINEDPYGEGWICEVRVIAEGDLMDEDAYRLLIEG